MKDINFFSSYVDKNKVKFDNTFFLAILFLVFSISLLGYSVVNQFKINKLEDKAIEFKQVIENPKTLEKLEAIKKDEEELAKLDAEVIEIRALKDLVLEKDVISSAYIESIISKRPNDLFFTSFNIASESVSITGISDTRLSVAKLTKGLETIEVFTDVFISSIVKDEKDYKFEIEVSLLEDEEVEDGSSQADDEESKE